MAGFLMGVLPIYELPAALKQTPKQTPADGLQTVLQDMRLHLNNLRHELSNHENEIRTFDNKLRNQDETVEALRSQIGMSSQSHKDVVKSGIGQLENRLLPLESSQKAFISDLKLLKDHSNDIAAGLSQLGQRLSKIESEIDLQNQHILALQEGMQAMIDALQVKDVPKPKKIAIDNSFEKTYKVRNGDSLGTIARDHQTTIQVIKDLNQLKNDRIIIGQVLKLP